MPVSGCAPDALHAAAYAMLGRLLDLDGARSSELSEFFGIDKGAVSRQVKILEDLGLVSREPDPQDGRAQQLVITEKGRERVTRAREERHRLMRRLLGPWEAGDVRTGITWRVGIGDRRVEGIGLVGLIRDG